MGASPVQIAIPAANWSMSTSATVSDGGADDLLVPIVVARASVNRQGMYNERARWEKASEGCDDRLAGATSGCLRSRP